MSDTRRLEGERVFCHQCSNEWDRARGGLQCPRCDGEFVEILSESTRSNEEDNNLDDSPYRSPFEERPSPRAPQPESRPTNPRNTFDDHNPWADAPDPEEGDISTWRYQTPGGRSTFSFTTTTYTGRGSPFGGGNHAGMFHFGPPASFGMNSTRGGAAGPDIGRGAQPGDMQDLFSAIFSTMQQAQQRPTTQRGFGFSIGGNASGAPNPFDLINAIFHGGLQNGRSGDAVWSQEAFDRIVEQLAEQGSNAPPPAPEAAIKSLPKKTVDKEMLGEDGKAECSICMDSVENGTEVTTLPCNHWFHEECVVAWLKEHNTCPHCRKPISSVDDSQNAEPSGSRRRGSRRSNSVGSPHASQEIPSQTPTSPSGIREACNRYYDRPESSRDPRNSRRSASPVTTTQPEQYYGGRHESTEYYAGRTEPSRHDSARRQSRHDQQRSADAGGGVAGWIRDHLPNLGGSR